MLRTATRGCSSKSLVVAVFAMVVTSTTRNSADEVTGFFESQVRPLLIAKCLDCHGPGEASGGLRLDSRHGLLKGGEHGAVVSPRDVDASRLVQAIRREGDLQMPPETPLSESEQQTLIRWIELGAPWPESTAPLKLSRDDAAKSHWAFQPLTDPEVPRLVDSPPGEAADSPRNEVDAFLLRRLQQAGLTMSPAADRRTLIRRLTYTLTGLPPASEAVEQFAVSTDPRAVEQLVESLLASPQYGQHWARHWLDVARYSDTKGYVYAREERFQIHAWRYRDWVVDALNEDLPYDRFLLLQLAADQVADRRDTDLAAMGFLTLGRRFLGVKRDIIDDRIDVVCRGTMALTVACARCHDHKYDPIPTADYYSLYGVFDSCREDVVALPPAVTDEAYQKLLSERQQALETLRSERREKNSARVRQRIADYLMAQTELHQYPEEGFDQILEAGDLLPSFVHRWRDFLRTARRDGDPLFAAWFRFVDLPAEEFESRAKSVAAELQSASAESVLPVIAAAFHEPPVTLRDVAERYARLFQDVDQRWQQALAAAGDGAAPERLPDETDERIRHLLYGPSALCEVPDESVVHIEYDVDSGSCNELWKLQGEVDRAILQATAEPAYAVILRDRSIPAAPRIFRRGNPADKGDDVPRRGLQIISGSDRTAFQSGSGRLELAESIIDPRNPLTARVIVNRVWAWHFGTGLVSTPGDFGLRAEPPSHPELLDWLTTRFIADGWSLKSLHRRIVLSAAFRQSSFGPDDPELRQNAVRLDPANRLLWRMNVHRLSFEELRDSMLAVSGHLDRRAGGRPAELFTAPYPRRRTLYGLVDRQFLPGALRVFDFANPDLHIPQRPETTVPQQALFLMNHPLALERARALAAAVDPMAEAEQQARDLFHRAWQREPATEELASAMRLLESADEQSTPAPPETAAQWSYGYGPLDEAAGRVAEFRTLPHFTGSAWQGGPAWPDATLGWVQVSKTGGHPGNDRQHASIRRWTAPADMTVAVTTTLTHEPDVSDGVRGFVVSSRDGVLAKATVRNGSSDLNVPSVSVTAGDTIDFVVDIGDELNSDQFLWSCSITRVVSAAPNPDPAAQAWNSESDFTPHVSPQLSPLEQLAQVLLCSNEFLFVD